MEPSHGRGRGRAQQQGLISSGLPDLTNRQYGAVRVVRSRFKFLVIVASVLPSSGW